MEVVWKVIFVFTLVGFFYLLSYAYKFQTGKFGFEKQPKGKITDFVWGLIAAVLFYIIDESAYIYLHKWVDREYLRTDRYKDPQLRARRVANICRWMYTVPAYMANSTWGYFILKNTSIMPWWLGGKGQCIHAVFDVVTFSEDTLQMKVFYMLYFGRSLQHLLQHLFVKSQGNYYEYALHHALTCFLVFYSYLLNLWLIGIMTMLIHDAGEAWLSASRGYGDCKFKIGWVNNLLHAITLIPWYFVRVFVHNACSMYSIFPGVQLLLDKYTRPDQKQLIIANAVFLGIFMIGLSLLNMFWSYYIAKAVITQFSKGSRDVD